MEKKKKMGLARYLAYSLISVAVYLIAAKIGLSLAFLNKSVSPVWPPVGIAVALIIILGYRFWPSVFIGAFIINFLTTPSALVSSGIAVGNTLEAFFGAYLIKRFAFGLKVFNNIKTTQKFFAISLVVPIVAAIVGCLSLYAGGFVEEGNFLKLIFTWWIGDVVGILIFTPIILLLYSDPVIEIERKKYVELFISLFAAILFSTIIFMGWPLEIPRTLYLAYLAIPILLWMTFRFSLRVAVISTFIMSSIAVIGISLEKTLFDATSANSSLIMLQVFVMITVISIISVSVIVSRYKKIAGE